MHNCKHIFVDIYSIGSEMEEDVIRWCEKCGAIRVDTDSDGRIVNKGRIRFPESNA